MTSGGGGGQYLPVGPKSNVSVLAWSGLVWLFAINQMASAVSTCICVVHMQERGDQGPGTRLLLLLQWWSSSSISTLAILFLITLIAVGCDSCADTRVVDPLGPESVNTHRQGKHSVSVDIFNIFDRVTGPVQLNGPRRSNVSSNASRTPADAGSMMMVTSPCTCTACTRQYFGQSLKWTLWTTRNHRTRDHDHELHHFVQTVRVADVGPANCACKWCYLNANVTWCVRDCDHCRGWMDEPGGHWRFWFE